MQHNHYTHVTDSQIVDPVVQLLEDIRNRKTKVIIPNDEDIIPSIWNDPTILNRVSAKVEMGSSSFNFEKPNKFPKIFQNTRSPDFPTAQQKTLISKLKDVPVYAVVTNKDEIVMASPRDDQNKNLFDWLYTKYYNWFVWREDDGPISITLFFLDKEDAELYLHEVGKEDPKMAEKRNIRVQLTDLGTFYKLNRTSEPGHQAKLVADLEEIDKVISKYIPQKMHDINPKQKYAKNSYQGNPIYLIRTTIGKKGQKKDFVNYTINDGKGNACTRNVFFKLEDAYLAWDKFCSDNKDIKLPAVPDIEIYNLESYLLDLEQLDNDFVKDNYFLATKKSFTNLEKEVKSFENTNDISASKRIKRLFTEKSKEIKDFCKGMVWVLTSDTLPTEENAW
nr:hypothetical protein [Hemiselmis andersenii]